MLLWGGLGTTVFGGMLFSTVVNLLFIPGLYVLVRRHSGKPPPLTPPAL
mgnify:CR=1 FL=1